MTSPISLCRAFINIFLKFQRRIKATQTSLPVESLCVHGMSLTANCVTEINAKLRKWWRSMRTLVLNITTTKSSHVSVRTCVRAYVRTCVRAYVRTCVRAYVSTCVHVCVCGYFVIMTFEKIPSFLCCTT